MRRLGYAETLRRFPHLVKPALFRNASSSHRLIGNLMWPLSRRVMMRMYDITPEAASESRAKLEAELDWLDTKLADGRPYLAGDRFSRADLTVASLLALFARPQEMPKHYEMPFPNALAADVERWRGRPAMRWVVAQYHAHRLPRRGAGQRNEDERSDCSRGRRTPVAIIVCLWHKADMQTALTNVRCWG